MTELDKDARKGHRQSVDSKRTVPFIVGDYMMGGDPVRREGRQHHVAVFPQENEAREYAAYRTAMLIKYNTDNVDEYKEPWHVGHNKTREKMDGWISVEDRLPEYKKHGDLRDGWFICKTINGHIIPQSWDDYNGVKCWHGYGGNSGCFRSDEIITHWMPLPATPFMRSDYA